MNRCLIILCGLWLFWAGAWASVQAQPATAGVTQADVEASLAGMRAYLLAEQDGETGLWPGDSGGGPQGGGVTALATLALLEAGVPAQSPAVQRAIAAMERNLDAGTYVRSLRVQVYAQLPDEFAPMLARDARWFVEQYPTPMFTYGGASPRGDHSNTHFAVLALMALAERGHNVPGVVWRSVVQHYLEAQNADGGWGYSLGGGSTANMTAGGLTALLVARRYGGGRGVLTEDLNDAIARGFSWVDAQAQFQSGLYGSGQGLYGLLAIERALLLDGRVAVGGRDWFRHDAEALIRQQRSHGGMEDVIDTSFAAIFLARGRVPVWATKLRDDEGDWDRRPDDLAHLTAALADWREAELGWQSATLADEPTDWLNAPVLYLSTGRALALEPHEVDRLRLYIDLGGMLVLNPENAASGFQRDLYRWMSGLYPGSVPKPVGEAHPLLTLVEPVDMSKGRRPWVLSQGARDLVVLLPGDWGGRMQGRAFGRGDAWEGVLRNLYAFATDRGRHEPRLHQPLGPASVDPPAVTVRVARALPGAASAVEPISWFALDVRWRASRGVRTLVKPVPLHSLYASESDVAHLAGVGAVELSASELASLRRYVEGGGTVLVETLGGHGAFASSVSTQLTEYLGRRPRRVQFGDGLGSVGPVRYRSYTGERFAFGDEARWRVFEVDGRAAVWVSDLDLSLG